MVPLKSKRIMAMTGATLVLVAAWMAFVYLPVMSSKNLLSEECLSLENEIERYRAGIGDIRQLYDNVGDLECRLSAILDELGSTDSIPEFIQALKEDMRGYGMNDINIMPELAGLIEKESITMGERSINRIEFRVTAKGGYLPVGRYIEHLREQPYYCGQTALNLIYNHDIDPMINVSCSFCILLENRG